MPKPTMPWEGPRPDPTPEPAPEVVRDLEFERKNKERMVPPAYSRRMALAMHAPPPPSWWKVRTASEMAIWAWTWADAMLATENVKTIPGGAQQPRLS